MTDCLVPARRPFPACFGEYRLNGGQGAMPGRPALTVRLHEGTDQNAAWPNPAVQSLGVIGPHRGLQRA